MLEQGNSRRAEYQRRPIQQALPTRHRAAARGAATPATPYFTTWVRQQVVDRYGARRAFEGGLRITTTLDLDLQRAAEQAVTQPLRAGGPTAALVAIDNETGEVRAMVGGRDYNERAVQPRHAGPAPAGLGVQAVHPRRGAARGHRRRLDRGRRARSVFDVPTASTEKFVVNNYEDAYPAQRTLGQRARVLRQRGLRAGRHQGRHAQDRRASPSGWASARRCRRTTR